MPVDVVVFVAVVEQHGVVAAEPQPAEEVAGQQNFVVAADGP